MIYTGVRFLPLEPCKGLGRVPRITNLAAIFRDQDDEGSGAVTAENWASNLDPEPSGNEDADEKDDADSAP